MFKLALDRLPSDDELCSQSTISRLENLPDVRALLRLGRALIEQYCASFRRVPKRIILDIDDTFDRVHGAQQLRLFNAYHDDYGFQPIVVFDGEGRFVTALLRPGKRPGGREIRAFLRRLVGPSGRTGRRSRSCCAPTAITAGRKCSNGVVPTGSIGCSASAPARCGAISSPWRQAPPSASRAAPGRGKVRRFKEFYDAARSWSRVERIIARVEAGPQGPDTRFIVTNLAGPGAVAL